LATHGAAQGGVVCEKAGIVDSPHEFLLVGEVDDSECVSVAQEVACKLDKAVFVWCSSYQQFPDTLDAIRDLNAGLQHRILHWSKRGVPATGPRWKNDGKFIFVV
jgi:hypothetical protein